MGVDGVDGRTLGHKAENELGGHSRTVVSRQSVGRRVSRGRLGFTSCLDVDGCGMGGMGGMAVAVGVAVADAVAKCRWGWTRAPWMGNRRWGKAALALVGSRSASMELIVDTRQW